MIECRSVFAARKKGEIIGFSGYDGNNRGRGFFGPLGVKTDYRGLGLGSVLVRICLQDMRKKHHQAIIPWVGPVCFYARSVGAMIDRVFWQYQKLF